MSVTYDYSPRCWFGRMCLYRWRVGTGTWPLECPGCIQSLVRGGAWGDGYELLIGQVTTERKM